MDDTNTNTNTNTNISIGAITIDNAIFKSEGYRFDEGMLAQLKQFKESPIRVIQTDIVHNEAIKHIAIELQTSKTLIVKALRSANKHLKISEKDISSAEGLLSTNGTDKEVALSRLGSFYDEVGVELIDSSEYVDWSELMDKYFNTEAPFETGKDKKHEFPDAIALLSIESWAEENNINIVAVSQDKGWKDFAAKSEHIIVVTSLSVALERFQPEKMVSHIISFIQEDSLVAGGEAFLEAIEQGILNSIEGYDIYIEADSYLYFEVEDSFSEYIDHELDLDSDGKIKVKVIRIDDASITVKVGALVDVDVEANFNFSVRDSVDKDYVGLGWATCRTYETYPTDVLITLSGCFEKDFDSLEVINVEVLGELSKADFGSIEPDWGEEEEEDGE